MKRKNNTFKTGLLLLSVCFISLIAWAQDYYHVYSGGVEVYGASGDAIDSIKVEGATSETVRFYKGGVVDYSITRVQIDSMIVNSQAPLLPGVQNVRAASGFNRILVKWDQNPNPAIDEVIVYWNNRAGSVEVPVTIKTPGCFQTDSVFIPGLTEGQNYQFEVVNKDLQGGLSAYSPPTLAITPYGDTYKASLKLRQVGFIKMTAFDAASHTGTVRLDFVEASGDFVGQRITYTKQGIDTPQDIIVTTNDQITLSNVGNELLNPNHLIYLKSLYLPEGGIDTVETAEYKTQIVSYIIKAPATTAKRFNYTAGEWYNPKTSAWEKGVTANDLYKVDSIPENPNSSDILRWGPFGTSTTSGAPANQAAILDFRGTHNDKDADGYIKYIWATEAQENLTKFRCDRVGTFGPLDARANTSAGTPYDSAFSVDNMLFNMDIDIATNKVAVSGIVKTAGKTGVNYNSHSDYMLVENGSGTGPNADTDPTHFPGDFSIQSRFDPVTRAFDMNYARWCHGRSTSNKTSTVFIYKLEPR